MRIPDTHFRVTTGYDRLNEAEHLNKQAGAHLWVVLLTYGVTAEEAAIAIEGIDQILDADHLLAVTQIGCYICEKEYDEIVGKPSIPA